MLLNEAVENLLFTSGFYEVIEFYLTFSVKVSQFYKKLVLRS